MSKNTFSPGVAACVRSVTVEAGAPGAGLLSAPSVTHSPFNGEDETTWDMAPLERSRFVRAMAEGLYRLHRSFRPR